MAAQGSRPLPPQYQHYIPQFILRNFSTRTSLDAGGSSTAHVPSDPRRDRARKNEYVVNHVDLSVENTTVQEKSGRRVFGEENMYDDDTQGHKEQRRVEKKLGKLESDASGLFRHMLKAFSEGQRGFWLYRNERNLIRKFLFVMKYRGPTFYERYHHSTLDTYTAEDKDQLSAYMQEKGFSRPIDVWLYNLETLIDLEMDNKGEWMADLPTRMYAHDAAWAVMHCQMFYMAVCTPSDPAAEFILTDNCFHVHEGPNNISTNWQTGESEVMGWLNLHEFAPVSPRLIIVLRSFLFPSELEDVSDPKAKERRGQLRSKAEALVGCIDTTPLADIPVSKARSNYTLLKANGELQMMPDEDGTLKPEHSFFFRFFSINLAHTNRINGVFLENVGLHTSIVFTTKDSFRHTLEWYLTDHKIFRKRVSASPEDSRRTCLLRLSQLLRYLGSSAKLYMEERAPPVLTDDEIFFMRLAALRELRQSLPSLLKEIPDGSPTEFIEFMSIYQSLGMMGKLKFKRNNSHADTFISTGGSISSLPEDMDQVSRMTRLRIKIDVWSQGIDEKLRQANRLYLVGIYRQFPRRRWWLYLKQWRRMTLSECDGINHDALIDAPEDIVAKGTYLHLFYIVDC